MSLVIAIKEKNKIIMGCDSQISGEWNKSTVDNKSFSKIFDILDCKKSLFGVVGRCRDAQLIQTEENLIDELKMFKNEINYKYVVRDLWNRLYKLLCDNNCVEKDEYNNYKNHIESAFIFAYKDTAFEIGSYGDVFEIQDYIAIGSGYDVAVGVLENNKNKTAEERIKEAIKIASEKTLFVDNNIVIKTT